MIGLSFSDWRELRDAGLSGPGTNTGDGHVWSRPDGFERSCAGPRRCAECASQEAMLAIAAIYDDKTPTGVEIALRQNAVRLAQVAERLLWQRDAALMDGLPQKRDTDAAIGQHSTKRRRVSRRLFLRT